MRVLLTGCNGLLGQKLISTVPAEMEIQGVDLHSQGILLSGEAYHSLDLGDRRQTDDVIRAFRPDWILNAAAYTNVDGAEAERDLCWRANVNAVENLVHGCRRVQARLCHLSTDYVFDGQNGPYAEDDPPHPLGFYGKSKLAGENVLRLSDIEFAVVRTMVMYGYAAAVRPNFVLWLLGKLSAGESVRIVNDQYGNTTLADELAMGIWRIVETRTSGFYHIAGREIVDRYHFARIIAEVFELEEDLIRPIATAELHQPAPRPMRSGLRVAKVLQTLGIELSGVRGGLLKLKEQMPSFSMRSTS